MNVNSYSSSVQGNIVSGEELYGIIYRACKSPEIRRIFAQQVEDICNDGPNNLYILVISIIVSMFIGVVLHTWYQNNLPGKTISVTQEDAISVTQEEIDSAKAIVRKYIASASTFSFPRKSRQETIKELGLMLTYLKGENIARKHKVIQGIKGKIEDIIIMSTGKPTFLRLSYEKKTS